MRVKELPIACTLTPAGMTDRAEWLQRLGSRSLRSAERIDGRLDLRFDPAAEPEVREWIAAEQECCAFLSFEIEPGERELRLAIGGPPGSAPVLDGLLTALT